MPILSHSDFTDPSRTKPIAIVGWANPRETIRHVAMTLTAILTGVTLMASSSAAQAQAVSPTTTGVMVILTVKAGVAREQVMAVMPAEIRQTVQLYLNGKIREWYTRSDGRGAATAAALAEVGATLGIADVEEAAGVAEIKNRLRSNTEDAIAAGIFGVPTLRVGDELFWGNDATPMVEAWLANPLLFASAEYRRIAQLPVGVERPR